MDEYKRESETIANIEKEIDILEQQELEIVSKRVYDEKISYLEKIIAGREDQINDLVHKTNEMEVKIDTLEKVIEDLNIKNSGDENIKTMERWILGLEKRSLGSDFCDFCEMELKAGSEKDAHVRATHTFKCNLCDLKLINKDEFGIHLLTCEMYSCSLCSYRHNRICELKSHCKTKHTRNAIIRHQKKDRETSLKFLLKTISVKRFKVTNGENGNLLTKDCETHYRGKGLLHLASFLGGSCG
jgi:DNA repair exonuclease SbcCD ATPase subunit